MNLRATVDSLTATVNGWLAMASGVVLAVVGIIALLVDADPAPTVAALLAGAALIAVGATLGTRAGIGVPARGGIWRALAGETHDKAELMARDLPEHLRRLFTDLARGVAAARYVEVETTLTRQLAAGPAPATGADPVHTIAHAVREIAQASVKEAWDAVAPLDTPAEPDTPLDLRTTELPPVETHDVS